MMKDCFIYDCVRSPRGKGKDSGSLHTIKPIELGGQILQAILQRKNIPSTAIEDVILGNATSLGEQGGSFAKACALHAGFSHTVPGLTINRACASSLEALNLSASKVMCGQNQLLIASGVESMSRVPLGLDGGPLIIDPEVSIKNQFIPQGVAADLLASLKRYSRRDLDQWAVVSHKRASMAQDRGAFKNSLHAIKDKLANSQLSYDELVRVSTSMESLANLNPSFKELGSQIGFDHRALSRYPELEKINHLHHPGNSSPFADGAGAILVGNARMAKKYNLKALAKIRAFATSSSDPTVMFKGMNNATQLALKQAGLDIEDIDLFEVNETFSAVVLNTIDEFNLDPEIVNVNGGAIAFGHPLGATGVMLVTSAIDELIARDQRLALITMGTFAGMGVTTIIERIAA